MFIAIVDLAVAPAKGLAALRVILAEAPSVRAMTGNIAFQAYLHPEDTGGIRIFHEWQDAAGLETYTASAAFKVLMQTLAPFMAAAPASRRLTASLVERLH
jgi:quinol monooxygenase YgiN